MAGNSPNQTDFAEMALHEALPTRSDRYRNTGTLQSKAGSNTKFVDSRSLRQRRKRGRISKACGQCHSRKQKCNGCYPCRNCIFRGVEGLCQPRVHEVIAESGEAGSLEETVSSRIQQTDDGLTIQRLASPQILSPRINQNQTPPKSTNNSASKSSAPGLREAKNRENEQAAPVGQLWKSRGAPIFFGSSYFGPHVAAALLDTSAPYVQPGANISIRSSIARPFRDEAGPFSQLWDLLGLLPRQRATVDRLVNRFMDGINWQIDAVHPQSFWQEYERFYSRKAGLDDVTTVDIRWLALLFIILAIGTYLDCPDGAQPEVQREYEESSMSFFWACRKAIVIAPSFYGESTDLVRTGILVTRYCLFSQRITESWLTVGFAARLAIAQGLHIDGTHWQLPRRITEARRRMWCHLYLLDRMISLALGRPYCILDSLSSIQEPENVFLDDLSFDEASTASREALDTTPTISALPIFSLRLAKVIGRIQEQTFGMRTASYREVMRLDAQLLEWKRSLPTYLAFEQNVHVLDRQHTYLRWHRLYLHTSYLFACVTLHRPFVFRGSVTDQHRHSRDVCLAAACADLKTRLEHDDYGDPTAHYAWCLGVPQLFNSAILLGLLAIQDHLPISKDRTAVINDLQAYCDKERGEIWVNDFRLAEVKVVELCIERLRRKANPRDFEMTLEPVQPHQREREEHQESPRDPQHEQILTSSGVRHNSSREQQTGTQSAQIHSDMQGMPSAQMPQVQNWQSSFHDSIMSQSDQDVMWSSPELDASIFARPAEAFYGAFSFPGPTELVSWQSMIDSLDREADGQQLG